MLKYSLPCGPTPAMALAMPRVLDFALDAKLRGEHRDRLVS